MSYNKASNLSVTTSRDGARYFRGDHDDRWSGNSYRGPRGRGYPRGNRRGGRWRHLNPDSLRYRKPYGGNEDEDGDVSMAGDTRGRYPSNNQSWRPRNSRFIRPPRGSASSFAERYKNPDTWFKVMIPFGSKIGRDELYSLIKPHFQGSFEPFNFTTDEKRAYFYVKGSIAADNIRVISRRLSRSDGHKIVFHVAPSEPPAEHAVDAETMEKLKLRMSDRYDPSTQLLNLSNLHVDEGLLASNIYLPLNRVSTMAAVTKIVAEYIPELSGLDISKNRILSLGHMCDLVKAAPNVTSLNLGHNQIRTLDELDKLKGWTNITELILDGNDLCNKFSNENVYISAVRKKFPKVVKLDGKDLPPPITFDLEPILTLPATKGSYFVNDEVQNLVVLFVKEYYTLFDSDKRRELMPAYHENAQFSYFAAKNILLDRQPAINNYFDDSRNLKRIGHIGSEKLNKKIKTGVLSVISCLEALPKTTHDMNSFVVDVSLATPTMITFSLQGLFRENENRSDRTTIRTFSRTFITVPSGPGMVIINDLWTISNASNEQIKNAFKSAAPTPSSSPVPSSQNVAGPSTQTVQSPSPVPFLSPAQIQIMVDTFSAQSGMNAEFSLKCLQENGWDYPRAAQVFADLHSQGKIPAEAFMKADISV
ncbi:hypothetical protein BsWGS_10526 [Bradybaena similaris]